MTDADTFRSRVPSVTALCEEDVIKKIRKKKVIVEWYKFSEERSAVTGTVRVANLAFKKEVQVRHTFNDWSTSSDLNLIWEGSVGDLGDTDKFGMVIPLPRQGWGGRVEFAILYSARGLEFWDNNNGKNYDLDVHQCDKDPYFLIS